jgi:hypothetical protein
MRNVWIIASREFRHYFVSPIAYALATMLYLILGGIFFINVYYGLQTGQITPDGRIVIGAMVTILLFATPAITMRLLADEYRMGTMELLLTAPVRDWELVVGKWLGALGFMFVVLAVTWVYPLILHRDRSRDARRCVRGLAADGRRHAGHRCIHLGAVPQPGRGVLRRSGRDARPVDRWRPG